MDCSWWQWQDTELSRHTGRLVLEGEWQTVHTNETRCRPSKGRRCIPDVIMWVHVETYLNVYEKNDSTNQCAQHKLKIVYKT